MADFPELQSMMAALDASPVRIGVTKAELKLVKRNLNTVMTLVMFVAP